MERHECDGPVRLRDMQSLSERVSPATGYRHVGDLAWNWCLSHDADYPVPRLVYGSLGFTSYARVHRYARTPG